MAVWEGIKWNEKRIFFIITWDFLSRLSFARHSFIKFSSFEFILNLTDYLFEL